MKSRKFWILVSLIIGISTYVYANYSTRDYIITSDAASLFDLSGVGVKVYTSLPETLQKGGLTGQMLQTATELRLRQFGISVLSEEEQNLVLGNPHLTVVVSVVADEETQVAALHVSVKIRQGVLLQRDIKVKIILDATTWEKSKTGLCSIDKTNGLVQEIVKNLLDEFLNDYLAANPKEQPTEKNTSNK